MTTLKRHPTQEYSNLTVKKTLKALGISDS